MWPAFLLAVSLSILPLATCSAEPGKVESVPAVQARVHHLVFVWLKPEHRSPATVQALIEAQQPLRTVPGLVSLDFGKPIMSERPVVEDSYDLVANFIFASREQMTAYLGHPVHIAFLRSPIQQKVERIVVFDFEQ